MLQWEAVTLLLCFVSRVVTHKMHSLCYRSLMKLVEPKRAWSKCWMVHCHLYSSLSNVRLE